MASVQGSRHAGRVPHRRQGVTRSRAAHAGSVGTIPAFGASAMIGGSPPPGTDERMVSPQVFAAYMLSLPLPGDHALLRHGQAAALAAPRPADGAAGGADVTLLPMAFNLGGYVEPRRTLLLDGVLGFCFRSALGLIGLSFLLLLVICSRTAASARAGCGCPPGWASRSWWSGCWRRDGWAVVMAGMAFTLLVGGAGQIQRYRPRR